MTDTPPLTLVSASDDHTANSDQAPQPDSGLMGLVMLARFHGISADPAQLAHLFKSPGEPFGTPQILLAAKHLGLRAKAVHTRLERLAHTPLPALAVAPDGHYFIIARADADKLLIQEPLSNRPEQLAVDDLATRWTGELILFTSRASLAGELARFDFSWFIPAPTPTCNTRKCMKRHRAEPAEFPYSHASRSRKTPIPYSTVIGLYSQVRNRRPSHDVSWLVLQAILLPRRLQHRWQLSHPDRWQPTLPPNNV